MLPSLLAPIVMKRLTTVTLALLLAVSMAAMPLAVADAGTAAGVQEDDETDEDVAPGEQLAGVVGVQEAELDGDVSERTYGIKVANAQTDNATADVVAEQFQDVEERLDNLEDARDNVTADYEAGEISHGEYSAKMATIAAEQRTAERLANGTATTAGGLDDNVLADRGIDVDAIQTLADRASELGGSEVSAIAQSIAGDRVGQTVGEERKAGAPIEPPHDRDGAPEDNASPDAPNETETDADEQDEADADEPEQSDADTETTDDDADEDDSDADDQSETDAGSQ